MHIESRPKHWLVLLPLCLLLALMTACGPKEQYTGAYKADAKDSSNLAETTLELKENGVGVWRVGDEEVSISWEVKGDELRVNTKGGGVIVGELHKGAIRITLPNSKTMTFKKMQ